MVATRANILALAATTLFGAIAAPAMAATINRDWEGHKTSDYCYAISFPKEKAERATERYLTVTKRPGKNIKDEIALTSGFPEEANIEGSVRVDGNLPFKLLVYKGVGYMRSPEVEGMAVKQMKAGHTLEVKWTAETGEYFVDTYSLLGFTASHGYTQSCQ